jgi:hypothetical protein
MDVEIQDINGKIIYESHDFQSYVGEPLELTPGSECEEILVPASKEMLKEINRKIKGKGYIRGMSDNDTAALSKLLPGIYKAVVFHHFELFKGSSTGIKNKFWTGKAKSEAVLFKVIK